DSIHHTPDPASSIPPFAGGHPETTAALDADRQPVFITHNIQLQSTCIKMGGSRITFAVQVSRGAGLGHWPAPVETR
ncbi:MAG: hypothetical protein ABGZ17_20535, partial [Planctomycetaceae bacterium]